MNLSKMLKLEAESISKNQIANKRNNCTDILISAKFEDHSHHILPKKPICYHMTVDLLLYMIKDKEGMRYILPMICKEFLNKNGRTLDNINDLVYIIDNIKSELNNMKIEDEKEIVIEKDNKVLKLENLNNES